MEVVMTARGVRPSVDSNFDKTTPAFKIHALRYNCRVPRIFDDFRPAHHLGEKTYLDKASEDYAVNEMVYKDLTVAEMATLDYRGAQIIIENPKDAITIYKDLQEYLRQMHEESRFSLSMAVIPITDISILDAFASKIYRVALPNVTEDIAVSATVRKLDRAFSSRRNMPIRESAYDDRGTTPTETDYIKSLPKDHMSVSDLINDFVVDKKRNTN